VAGLPHDLQVSPDGPELDGADEDVEVDGEAEVCLPALTSMLSLMDEVVMGLGNGEPTVAGGWEWASDFASGWVLGREPSWERGLWPGAALSVLGGVYAEWSGAGSAGPASSGAYSPHPWQ